jgi:hypothetical protein
LIKTLRSSALGRLVPFDILAHSLAHSPANRRSAHVLGTNCRRGNLDVCERLRVGPRGSIAAQGLSVAVQKGISAAWPLAGSLSLHGLSVADFLRHMKRVSDGHVGGCEGSARTS